MEKLERLQEKYPNYKKSENSIEKLKEKYLKENSNDKDLKDLIKYMSRKEPDVKDLDVLPTDMYAEYKDLIDELKTYDAEQLYENPEEFNLLDYFKRSVPRFFILENDGERILVDTEGFDYARYSAILPNLGSKESFESEKNKISQEQYGKDYEELSDSQKDIVREIYDGKSAYWTESIKEELKQMSNNIYYSNEKDKFFVKANENGKEIYYELKEDENLRKKYLRNNESIYNERNVEERVTSFNCPCGNKDPKKTYEYDGALGYEAIICTVCGRIHDDKGVHPADSFSKQFIKKESFKGKEELKKGDIVKVTLNNGDVISGKLEKENPIKIRTDATSTKVIPNGLIKDITKESLSEQLHLIFLKSTSNDKINEFVDEVKKSLDVNIIKKGNEPFMVKYSDDNKEVIKGLLQRHKFSPTEYRIKEGEQQEVNLNPEETTEELGKGNAIKLTKELSLWLSNNKGKEITREVVDDLYQKLLSNLDDSKEENIKNEGLDSDSLAKLSALLKEFGWGKMAKDVLKETDKEKVLKYVAVIEKEFDKREKDYPEEVKKAKALLNQLKESTITITSAWNMPKTKQKLEDLAKQYAGEFDAGKIKSLVRTKELNDLLGKLKDMGLSYNLSESLKEVSSMSRGKKYSFIAPNMSKIIDKFTGIVFKYGLEFNVVELEDVEDPSIKYKIRSDILSEVNENKESIPALEKLKEKYLNKKYNKGKEESLKESLIAPVNKVKRTIYFKEDNPEIIKKIKELADEYKMSYSSGKLETDMTHLNLEVALQKLSELGIVYTIKEPFEQDLGFIKDKNMKIEAYEDKLHDNAKELYNNDFEKLSLKERLDVRVKTILKESEFYDELQDDLNLISKKLFNKPLKDLTEDEVKKVNEEYNKAYDKQYK
jgi:hypothetical protein